MRHACKRLGDAMASTRPRTRAVSKKSAFQQTEWARCHRACRALTAVWPRRRPHAMTRCRRQRPLACWRAAGWKPPKPAPPDRARRNASKYPQARAARSLIVCQTNNQIRLADSMISKSRIRRLTSSCAGMAAGRDPRLRRHSGSRPQSVRAERNRERVRSAGRWS